MGLLSDPERRKSILSFLRRWEVTLSVIGYIGGILGLMVMANDKYNSRGEILEGALLPGMVETKYSEDQLAQKYYQKLTDMCNQDIQLQRKWLENELLASGIEVFEQNFSCNFGKTKGKNIYGILRSGRSSGVESLVLNVPVKSRCQSNGAIALMLSVANYFKHLNCWAKDIIFLVTENGSCGVTAWLQGYHGQKSKDITSSDLLGYAGKIQAALLIDFPNNTISGIDIYTEASNGLQPDLDLIGMIRIISQSEGIPVKLHTQDDYYGSFDQMESYLQQLKTLTRTILYQASGYSSGDHGTYLDYRIEALTIKAVNRMNVYQHNSFLEMGRLTEAAFRSFNNLLEHFHQSYFFYLLPETGRFIRIIHYMPALGGLLLSVLLHSISTWMEIFTSYNEPSADKVHQANNYKISWRLGLLLIMPHLFGGGLFLTLSHFAQNNYWLADGNISKAVMVSSLTLMFTLHKVRPLKSETEWTVLKMMLMIYLAVVIVTSAMLNFCFGFLLAVGFIPCSVLVKLNGTRLRRALRCIMVALCSPICLIALLEAFHIFISKQSDIDLGGLINESFKSTDMALNYAVSNGHLQVWTFPIISLVIFPIWFLLAVLSSPLNDS